MAEHDPRVLKQRDLSHLSVRDMTPFERAELYRRYTTFVAHFGVRTTAAPPQRPVRKWVPGERAAAGEGA
ncbi:MAG TPA: hypothetical protein VMU87_12045 [Stellaceae bacterium]|nr:hypothetical protein [Stellaceae bacterium]